MLSQTNGKSTIQKLYDLPRRSRVRGTKYLDGHQPDGKQINNLMKTMQTKENKSKCLFTNGCNLKRDLVMQINIICYIPEAKAALESIINGWRSKHYVDKLSISNKR